MCVCVCVCVPLFHMLFDQKVVVSRPGLVGSIAKVGAHMNPVPVLVVMDTTTQVHFHNVCLFTDLNLHTIHFLFSYIGIDKSNSQHESISWGTAIKQSDVNEYWRPTKEVLSTSMFGIVYMGAVTY